MADVPIVYLDAQDYSRFGDALCGDDKAGVGTLFEDLERRKRAGSVRFAMSMPLLMELLQYSESYREKTYKRAEAVHRLCGPTALAFPPRLVAAQVAQMARASDASSVVSEDYNWYPNVPDAFDNLDSQLRTEIEAGLGSSPFHNRKMRRGLKKLARSVDLQKLVRQVTPEFAAKYGLPEHVVRGSVVARLRNQVTSLEASRMLFGSIAQPEKFVEVYFELLDNDRSLPQWMVSFGEKIQASLETLRETVQPVLNHPEMRERFRVMLAANAPEFGKRLLALGRSDASEFGISNVAYDTIVSDSALASQVPAARVGGLLMASYAAQILGYAGPAAKVERSFGGDLVHALYLPHVDLWRTDGRFAELVKQALPEYGSRVVSKLRDLPASIDALAPKT